MDTEPDFSRLDNFAKELEKALQEFTPQTQSSFNAEFISQESTIYVNSKPQNPIQTINTAEEKNFQEKNSIDESPTRKSYKKSSKKRLKGRLKKQGRFKKYKGQCPFF